MVFLLAGKNPMLEMHTFNPPLLWTIGNETLLAAWTGRLHTTSHGFARVSHALILIIYGRPME